MFDVLIPCYNYGRFLRPSAESVLAQTPELRILIIDDASTDETEEVGRDLARSDERVTFRRHPANMGHIATYNEAIDWAKGRFFTILSADDVMMPGALQRAAMAFSDMTESVMVYGRALYFRNGIPIDTLLDGSALARPWPHNAAEGYAEGLTGGIPARLLETELRAVKSPSTTPEFFRQNRDKNQVHMCSVIARTEVQKRIGGYRVDLPHAGDYEMWLRFAAHGPIGFIPQFQIAGRLHSSNMSGQYYRDHAADILQRKRALDAVETACRGMLPTGLMAEMRHGLATAAVRAAGGPLAQKDRGGCDQLLSLAKSIDPGIVRSPIWRLFSAKRALSPAIWERVPRPLRSVALRVLGLS